ncbi:MAG TPA: D-TA family PLP-dependent enzyme [Gemmataceae bacterium]|jgi:D-serine deaminase-like pyridoxal phosphate-dependent protein|nr:D-TA family PLP-dependent enzyme [Gemmataceae bacterium]
MQAQYVIQDPSGIFSPAMLFYKDIIDRNLARIVSMAGGTTRLRPHVKTHKTREIARLELQIGITKHKCATLAEAEMLAQVNAPDVLVAYNMVGPNCARLARLIHKYPATRFSVLADHAVGARMLSDALTSAGTKVHVLIDLDVGQHRTGMAPGKEAVELYASFAHLPGLIPDGLSVYDGHNHQEAPAERAMAVQKLLGPVLALRSTLESKGLPVPRIVAGGTPTFPVFAKLDIPGLECSPGTCVLHDHSYSRFADLADFMPAALLLTRVVSRPTPTRVTLDLGYKALASDPPAGKRCVLLNVPDYEPVLQNEEHFVIETSAAAQFLPGDVVYAVPTHICPTCAVHKQAYVVENNRVIGTWDIAARDRTLTV